MSKIYEINKYNQEPDADEQFLDDKFPTFIKIEDVENYLKGNPELYGKVFEYDKDEYLEYENASELESFSLDVPEPTNEWVTDDIINEFLRREPLFLLSVKQLEDLSLETKPFVISDGTWVEKSRHKHYFKDDGMMGYTENDKLKVLQLEEIRKSLSSSNQQNQTC